MRGALHTDQVIEKLKQDRETIVAQCKKEATDKDPAVLCSRSNGEVCQVYAFPKAKWRHGDCPMADPELRTRIIDDKKVKVRVGQQKQKKKHRR